MRLRVLCSLFVAGLLTMPLASLAEELTHKEAQVKLWAPDDWEQEQEDDTLTITSPDEDIAVIFSIFESDDLEAAVDGLAEGLDEFIEDAELMGDPAKGDINGMPTVAIDAKGTVDGEDVYASILLVNTPADKLLICLAIGEKEAVEADAKTIQKIFKGMKPDKSDKKKKAKKDEE